MPLYPTVKEMLDGRGTFTIKRSLISLLSLLTLFIVSSAVIVFLTIFTKKNTLLNLNIFNLEPYYFYFFPLIIALEIIRRIYNDLYILSKNRLTHFRGRLSLAYNVPVIRVEDIRAINVIQDFGGRIFNFGDVIIGTSAHIGPEIIVTGIRDPENFALLVDGLRREIIEN